MTKKNVEERLNVLEQEVRKLKEELKGNQFKGLKVGDSFVLIGLKWTILDITDAGYVCISDRLEKNMQFDSYCNNWESSDLRNYLNTVVCEKICEEIEKENLEEFERDLLSLDGQTEYGTCKDKVSIISLDEYRKYRALIPNTGYYWWTLTPDSAKCNGDTRYVRVVCPSGDFNCNCCDVIFGVRSFCIFSSALFESEE